jgi:hypothetical protein
LVPSKSPCRLRGNCRCLLVRRRGGPTSPRSMLFWYGTTGRRENLQRPSSGERKGCMIGRSDHRVHSINDIRWFCADPGMDRILAQLKMPSPTTPVNEVRCVHGMVPSTCLTMGGCALEASMSPDLMSGSSRDLAYVPPLSRASPGTRPLALLSTYRPLFRNCRAMQLAAVGM